MSSTGVVGGCHLTGLRSCMAPDTLTFILGSPGGLGTTSHARVSRGRKVRPYTSLTVAFLPRGNRTPRRPGEQWGFGASASPTITAPRSF